MQRTTLLSLLCLWAVSATAQSPNPDIVRAGYAHPQGFWDTGAKLNEYGLNAVIIHSGGINEETLARARGEGCEVYAEFATLNGKVGDFVTKHPDAHPIDDSGNPAPAATWFMGACPTHAGFKQFRMDELRAFVAKYDVDGVWLDYLHWHAQFEDPYPIFIKTCFNDSCIAAFQTWANVKVEGTTTAEKAKWILDHEPRKWEDWRVSVIVDWTREMHGIVKAARPNALVGNYQCPFRAEDLGGVLRRCLGLDFEAMKPYVDVYSPMVYHGRMGQPPEVVKDYVEYFSARYDVKTAQGEYPRLWPIVQAHDDPRVSPQDFEKVLRYGLLGKSTGVMMFTLPSVAADKEKMEVMKKVYLEYAQKAPTN